MCSEREKSMILLKDEVYCPGDINSHSEMLERLKIKDTKRSPDFVRVEIMPPNKDFFAPLEEWKYRVDQDFLPDWYVKEVDEERAREALKIWAIGHILVAENGFEMNEPETFYLKDCEGVVCKRGAITARGSSTVEAYDSSTVEAYDSSTVEAYGSSAVKARGSSTVEAYGSSTVEAYDSSTVEAYDSSAVKARGSSTVEAYDSSTILLPEWFSSELSQFRITQNATLKDCRTKTIYQAGDWKFVPAEGNLGELK